MIGTARSPALGRRRRVRWPPLALGALGLGALALFAAYPTFPNYDSYYSLVWGRELLHGVSPGFDAYRAPTEHPLAITFGAGLSILGDAGDRVLVAATLASFVALVAGLYRLAAASFTPLVGAAAAALLCTRFDFPFLALRAYVDVPYLALVLWAAALEAEQRRRGTPVFALLACAGLLRPEAWVLSAAYFAWMGWPRPWAAWARDAALVVMGPLVWTLVDLMVTGEPLFSLRHTSGLAEELGRRQNAGVLPATTWQILRGLDKLPVLYAGVVGLVITLAVGRRRAGVPLALLILGLGTFTLLVTAGSSVIYRYLTIPSLMVMIFAAVSLAGWTLLPTDHAARRPWALAAALLLAYGIVFTATHLTPSKFVDELRFRRASHAALQRLLRSDQVVRGRRCGPVSLPNHKLVPEARWILGAGQREVIARSDPASAARETHGVAIYATSPKTFRRYGFGPDDISVAVPLPGFRFRVSTDLYAAYIRC